MAESQVTKTKAYKRNPDYIRKKLPSQKIQKLILGIEKRIAADEKAAPEQKLKVREIIGLCNSAASLGRLLQQADKDAKEEKKKKGNSAFGGF